MQGIFQGIFYLPFSEDSPENFDALEEKSKHEFLVETILCQLLEQKGISGKQVLQTRLTWLAILAAGFKIHIQIVKVTYSNFLRHQSLSYM